jgi:colanic acid/amylovoran biosynthesis glycosyltransferase
MPDAIPRVGYVLKRYPRFSETFVVNEILDHEAAGLPLEILALRPVIETHFQDTLSRVRAPVTYLPDRLGQATEFWQLLRRGRDRLPGFAAAFRPGEDAEDVAQALRLALLVQARGVTHLHAHFATVATTVARLAAALAGITYSFTAHAKDIYFDYEAAVRLGPKLRDAAFAVTVSDYNLRHLREQHGPDAAGALRIYNGLDLSRLPWSDPGDRPPLVLAVGRLVEKKGFHVLIEACRRLHGRGVDFACRIVGDGPERAKLHAQLEQAGLVGIVELAGPRPQQDVFTAMREAALLAAPCIVSEDGNRDGLPTVLLEAMACGLPCISTDVTGIPELVRDDDTGLCVAQGDPDSLADGIARLLTQPALRAGLSRKARALVEDEFDIRINAARLRALFRDCAAARQATTHEAVA